MTDEQTRFEVLLESMEDKFRVAVDATSMMNATFSRFDQKFDRFAHDTNLRLLMLDANVSLVKQDVAALKTDVAALKEDVSDMKPRLVRVERSLGLSPASRKKRGRASRKS